MCDISYGDYETCEVWDSEVVIARKDHVCDCCDGRIRKRTAYTKHVAIADGAVTREKVCGPCSRVIEAFVADHGMSFSPSFMWEAIEECFHEDEQEKKWLFAILGMKRRQKARYAREALAWRPALPMPPRQRKMLEGTYASA